MSDAIDYFERGGPVMYVLVVCSVAAVAVFLERLVALRSSAVAPRSLLHEVEELVKAGKLVEAVGRCLGSGTPAGHIFAAVLRKANADANKSVDEKALREVAQETGRRESAR